MSIISVEVLAKVAALVVNPGVAIYPPHVLSRHVHYLLVLEGRRVLSLVLHLQERLSHRNTAVFLVLVRWSELSPPVAI